MKTVHHQWMLCIKLHQDVTYWALTDAMKAPLQLGVNMHNQQILIGKINSCTCNCNFLSKTWVQTYSSRLLHSLERMKACAFYEPKCFSGIVYAAQVGKLQLMCSQVIPKTWKTTLAVLSASCSSQKNWCMGILHVLCWPRLVTLAFTWPKQRWDCLSRYTPGNLTGLQQKHNQLFFQH